MLFNSYPFLFIFLPLTLLGCLALSRWSSRVALGYVSLASLVFYGYWEPKYLLLLIPSLLVNYALGRLIFRTRSKAWLILGVCGNLAVIGWFKYSLFLFLTATGGAAPPDFLKGIVLPLGISFITFQKIAYLVDVWHGYHVEDSLDRFSFFVLFFPQLIAGPIVLFRNMEPQIYRWPGRDGFLAKSFQVGVVFFAIGLFKKVVLADSLAPFATDVFAFAARTDYDLSILDAWVGALAYSLQLYFDFSGYSDMAIGLGRMFGFRLPINFNSPYKAVNIIHFWRRWHITLSSFFRDYVYIPLGGNRKGLPKQILFILVVFFLTGLWHGAGWTFIAWGCIHGVLVVANHIWSMKYRPITPDRLDKSVSCFTYRVLSHAVTLLCVITLWVIFRAQSWEVAVKIIKAMYLLGPTTQARAFPDQYLYYVAGATLAILWVVVTLAPNSSELVRKYRAWGLVRRNSRAPNLMVKIRAWIPAMATGIALYFAVSSIAKVRSEFIYFNF